MQIKTRTNKDENQLTLEEHFSELKKRLFVIVGTLIILFLICLLKSGDILNIFLEQGRNAGYNMIALSPQEALLQQIRVSFTCGFLIAIPVLLYEITIFVIPAFDKNSVKKLLGSVIAGTFLFITGICFSVYILFPFVLKYMTDVTVSTGIMMEISVENYISFFLTMTILLGLVFEIPMISLFLSSIGIVNTRYMKKYRKIVIVLILVLAAVITPPDIVSQVMVAVPMFILYEISIFLCNIVEKNKEKTSQIIGETN